MRLLHTRTGAFHWFDVPGEASYAVVSYVSAQDEQSIKTSWTCSPLPPLHFEPTPSAPTPGSHPRSATHVKSPQIPATTTSGSPLAVPWVCFLYYSNAGQSGHIRHPVPWSCLSFVLETHGEAEITCLHRGRPQNLTEYPIMMFECANHQVDLLNR